MIHQAVTNDLGQLTRLIKGKKNESPETMKWITDEQGKPVRPAHTIQEQFKETTKQQEKQKQQEKAKDKRIQMEGTQQSKMIEQRKNNLLPIDFEKNEEPEQSAMATQEEPQA